MPRYRLVPEPDIFRCHALSRKARNGPPAPTREKQKNSPLQSRKFLCAQTKIFFRTNGNFFPHKRIRLCAQKKAFFCKNANS